MKPLISRRAVTDQPGEAIGGRSIRFHPDDGGGGLATTTYSYQLTHCERIAAAQRLALLWNLALGIPTDQLTTRLRVCQ